MKVVDRQHLSRLGRVAAALEAYDAALALSPRHPDALIGRTVALSQLGRAQDAITTATTVIDGGQWMVGEAYYWRAWNQLRLGNLPMAREDADRARTQMANARVFVLSGVIEWRMRRLENAERDFQQAVTIDLGECEGAFDLGIVRDELRQVPQSLAAFRQAGQCNDLSIKLRREAIAKIEAGPGTPASRDRDALDTGARCTSSKNGATRSPARSRPLKSGEGSN
jgi:tetratricopeptide (TPR) repeat protein